MLTILYTCIRARMYTTWPSQTLSTQTVTDRTVPTVTNTCSTLLQANNGSTCTSWTPTEHTLIKSQSQRQISHLPVNLQSTFTQFAINLLICNSILRAIYLHYNLQSTCSFVTQYYFATLQLQLAFKLPAICNPLLFAYNFNWHSNCVQFTIILLFATLQLQLAFKLPAICNPLLLAYNFNWHSNCLQFTIILLFTKLLQLAFKLPAICNPLLFAYNFNWHINCLQFAIRLLFAYNYYWHSNCLQFAIRLLFAYNHHFATRFSDLHLLRVQCLRKVNSDMRTFSCHQLHLIRKKCTNLNGVAVLWSSTSVWECHFDYI